MNPFPASLVAVVACVPQPTALCCACGPSTMGQNEVRDMLLDYTRLADATAEPKRSLASSLVPRAPARLMSVQWHLR